MRLFLLYNASTTSFTKRFLKTYVTVIKDKLRFNYTSTYSLFNVPSRSFRALQKMNRATCGSLRQLSQKDDLPRLPISCLVPTGHNFTSV